MAGIASSRRIVSLAPVDGDVGVSGVCLGDYTSFLDVAKPVTFDGNTIQSEFGNPVAEYAAGVFSSGIIDRPWLVLVLLWVHCCCEMSCR